jgi:hypothetical protein
MEKEENVKAALSLRHCFQKANVLYPNLAYDLIRELINLQNNKNINLNEMLLRSEKIATSDGKLLKLLNFNLYSCYPIDTVRV